MTERSGQMPQTTKVEECFNSAQAVRPAPRRRQMAGWNTVVHAVRPISLAKYARQINPGLTITGNPGNVGYSLSKYVLKSIQHRCSVIVRGSIHGTLRYLARSRL